jgi:hypothetical protein
MTSAKRKAKKAEPTTAQAAAMAETLAKEPPAVQKALAAIQKQLVERDEVLGARDLLEEARTKVEEESKAKPKAKEAKPNSMLKDGRILICKNPKLTNNELMEELIKLGHDAKGRESTESTIRSDTRNTLAVLKDLGKLNIDL